MDPEPTYTLYIRLPFARGDFVDPPPVNWDSSKDEALWNILSGVSKREIDWDAIAADFDVTVDFLLRQVTYLTERHASQVRAQMRKATASKGSAAPSPVPGSESGTPMAADMRTGSGGGTGAHGRAPSSLSIRRDGGSSAGAPSSAKQPAAQGSRPQVSRTSSATTAVPQQRPGPRSSTPRQHGGADGESGPQRKRLSSLPMPATLASANRAPRPEEDDDGDDEDPQDDDQSPGPAESSSASSSASSSPAQSRIIRRPPRFTATSGGGGGGGGSGGAGDGPASPEEEDDDAEPAFLPFSGGQHTDLSATLRGDPREFAAAAAAARRATAKGGGGTTATPKDHRVGSLGQSQTSDSSTGSAALINRSPARDGRGPGPLSPKRTAELSGRARGKGHGNSSDGGTPSMGSSFSDLDDASVTQSALEEALASNMQTEATIGSRMSTIGQAFRSRYLPKANRP